MAEVQIRVTRVYRGSTELEEIEAAVEDLSEPLETLLLQRIPELGVRARFSVRVIHQGRLLQDLGDVTWQRLVANQPASDCISLLVHIAARNQPPPARSAADDMGLTDTKEAALRTANILRMRRTNMQQRPPGPLMLVAAATLALGWTVRLLRPHLIDKTVSTLLLIGGAYGFLFALSLYLKSRHVEESTPVC